MAKCEHGLTSKECFVCASPKYGEAAPLHPAMQELKNIGYAKRFNRAVFSNDTEFADWAQSRARHTFDKLGGK